MNTEVLVRQPNEITESTMPRLNQNIEQNLGTNIGYAERVENTVVLMSGNGTLDSTTTGVIDNTLSDTYCNLFIMADVKFDGDKNCFTINKDKALKHHSSETFDVSDEKIKTFPALFITTNGAYKRCKNPGQCFYYGLITEVNEREKNIEICFLKLWNKPLPQQRLNEIASELEINVADGVDMLDHTNWLIKPLNIRKALTDAGIEYK